MLVIAKAIFIGSVAGAAHILLPAAEHWGLVASATPSFFIARTALAVLSLILTYLSLHYLYRLWRTCLPKIMPALGVMLTAGFAYYLIALHWLGEAFLSDHQTYTLRAAVGLMGCMAIFVPWWGLAGAVAALATRIGIHATVAFAVCFSVADVMLGDWVYEIPLAPLSFVFLDTPFEFLLKLLGQHGATFVLVAAATLPRPAPALCLPILLLMVAIRAIAPPSYTPLPNGTRIALIQPLSDPTDPEGIFDDDTTTIRRLAALTASAASNSPPLIALPEAAIPADLSNNQITAAEPIFSSFGSDTLLVAGFYRVRASNPADPATLRPVNSSGVFDHTGQASIIYDKSHLVPFGEYMPRLFSAIGYDVMAGPPGGFSAGDGMSVYDSPDGSTFSLAICYEAILSGPVSRETKGADWILNQSSERMFGHTIGPKQLLGYTRLRAIETGLPIYRAVMSGGTSAIDADGRIQVEMKAGERGVLHAPPLSSSPTIFRQTGYAPLYAIWIIATAGSLFMCIQRRLHNKHMLVK